jgi:hypothetical protein
MFTQSSLSLCALVPMFLLPTSAQERTVADVYEVASIPSFTWGDLDGDGDLDLVAVGAEGRLTVLENAGGVSFMDVTAEVGLAGVGDAALVLGSDYDLDGRLDLFVGARDGSSRLFRNELGLFVDVTEGSGLEISGAVRSARWLDHDGDGRPDLFVVTRQKSELFRGLQ